MRDNRLCAILTPLQGNRIPDKVQWCADNGAYGKGFPGEQAWFTWLSNLPYDKALCEFAVAPDVVADAKATLARSLPWLPRIREIGVPAAFVAQDGIEDTIVPWDEFDVLFIGGSTEFKLGESARQLTATARALGKRVHMGRVNSRRRLRIAQSFGCTSADGTYLAYGPSVNLPRLLGWLAEINTTKESSNVVQPR